jgi:hypothetical protein
MIGVNLQGTMRKSYYRGSHMPTHIRLMGCTLRLDVVALLSEIGNDRIKAQATRTTDSKKVIHLRHDTIEL